CPAADEGELPVKADPVAGQTALHDGLADELARLAGHAAREQSGTDLGHLRGRCAGRSLIDVDVAVHDSRLDPHVGGASGVVRRGLIRCGGGPLGGHDRPWIRAMTLATSADRAATSPTSPRTFFSASVTAPTSCGPVVRRVSRAVVSSASAAR